MLPRCPGTQRRISARVACARSWGWLHDSHLLPTWTYRRVESGAPNFVIMVRNGIANRGGKQLTERLLCAKCEQLFARSSECISRSR